MGVRAAAPAGRQFRAGAHRRAEHPPDVAAAPLAPVIPIRPETAPRQVTPQVQFRPRRWLIIVPLLLIGGVSLTLHWRLIAAHHVPLPAVIVWGLALSAVIMQILLAWLGRPYTADPPDGLKVTVVVPCYNEDPAYLRRVLDSLRVQTRKPARVIVCDDGSKVS
jgi:hypothetical protein